MQPEGRENFLKTFKGLIRALCERLVLVQVLQLAVPAPLVAGVPAGHKTPDHALEEAADECLWGAAGWEEGRGEATKEDVTHVLHSTAHGFPVHIDREKDAGEGRLGWG